MKSIAQLLDVIEGVGFECEGGPLKTLQQWTELRVRLAELTGDPHCAPLL